MCPVRGFGKVTFYECHSSSTALNTRIIPTLLTNNLLHTVIAFVNEV